MPKPRHAALLALALAGLGCAHVEPPSGGPEDRTPPLLLAVRPDSLAVLPSWTRPVVFVFDERVSERGVQQAVTVSPRTSPVRVDHSGDEIRVELEGGWRPGTIYHVTVLPEILDLFQNRRTEPVRLVFSTGPAIPATAVEGRVVDRLTDRPEAGARVEAIRAADSLVYAVRTDSTGRFRIANVPEGEYRLRAFQDQNRNRALDPFEARDSVAVALAAGDPLDRRLGLLMPDSTGPQIASARLQNDTLRVLFDDHLDPDQELSPGQVSIVGPQGDSVPVAAVALGAAQRGGQRPARPDTAVAAPQRPLPSQTLLVVLAPGAALQPGAEHRVAVRGIRNVVGLAADVESTFTAPAAPTEPPAAPDPAARPPRSPAARP